jgi:hypothetical protein
MSASIQGPVLGGRSGRSRTPAARPKKDTQIFRSRPPRLCRIPPRPKFLNFRTCESAGSAAAPHRDFPSRRDPSLAEREHSALPRPRGARTSCMQERGVRPSNEQRSVVMFNLLPSSVLASYQANKLACLPFAVSNFQRELIAATEGLAFFICTTNCTDGNLRTFLLFKSRLLQSRWRITESEAVLRRARRAHAIEERHADIGAGVFATTALSEIACTGCRARLKMRQGCWRPH